MSRDPYYHSLDGYDAYQSRELLKREYKDGKVYSTYKCSNLGGEVDIFTTVCDPIKENNNDLKNEDNLNDFYWLLKELWDNLIPICSKICFAILIILATITVSGLVVAGLIDWFSLLSR